MSEVLLSRLFEATWQGLIAMAAVWAITRLFRGLNANTRCWLWRLCGLKLAISLLGVLSLPVLAPDSDTIPHPPTDFVVVAATTKPDENRSQADVQQDPTNLLVIGWACGALIYGTIVAIGARGGQRSPDGSGRWSSELVSSMCLKMGLRTQPEFSLSDTAASPFLVGIIRPRIVIPRFLLKNPGHLAMAVAHELAHYKRRDVLWQCLMTFMNAIFWFLPPMHWVTNLAKVEAEIACDCLTCEMTLAEPTAYMKLMVNLGRPNLLPLFVVGMASRTRRNLERRLQAMNRSTGTFSRPFLTVVVLLALPSLVPWRAVAQNVGPTTSSTKELDQLAKSYPFPEFLNLSQKQKEQLQLLEESGNREFRAFGQKLQDMKKAGISDRDRIKFDNKTRMPLFNKYREGRWTVLTREQQARQKQIVLQYLGPLALGRESIANLVGASENQWKSIAQLNRKYSEFMTRQDRLFWSELERFMGYKEVKIREFTNAEKSRLAQIERESFTATGKRRIKLKNEYYLIRARGIRYDRGSNQSKPGDWNSRRVAVGKEIMNARRKELARLSAEALQMLNAQQLKKWTEIQGEPVTFPKLESGDQVVFGYR